MSWVKNLLRKQADPVLQDDTHPDLDPEWTYV